MAATTIAAAPQARAAGDQDIGDQVRALAAGGVAPRARADAVESGLMLGAGIRSDQNPVGRCAVREVRLSITGAELFEVRPRFGVTWIDRQRGGELFGRFAGRAATR